MWAPEAHEASGILCIFFWGEGQSYSSCSQWDGQPWLRPTRCWCRRVQADSAAPKRTPGATTLPVSTWAPASRFWTRCQESALIWLYGLCIDHIGKRFLKLLKFLRHLSKDIQKQSRTKTLQTLVIYCPDCPWSYPSGVTAAFQHRLPCGVWDSRLWSQMDFWSHPGPTFRAKHRLCSPPQHCPVGAGLEDWGEEHRAPGTVLATSCTLTQGHKRILMSELLVAKLPPKWPNHWRRECFIFVPECRDG